MSKAYIVNAHGQRLGRAELEARIASALAEAETVLAPGILAELISDLSKRTAQASRQA